VEESKLGTPVLEPESPHAEDVPPDGPGKPPLRLYRSRSERMLGGVCGGLGQYFNVDPVWLRLAFVVLALGGAGVLAYLILWIVIPGRPLTEPEPAITTTPRSGHGKEVLAWALVAIGLVVLATNLNLLPWWDWRLFWPAVLIVAGVALLTRRDVPSA